MPDRIQARSLMWAADYVKAMFSNLQAGATVTKFVMGSESDDDQVEFEIVVTKIGAKRLPRVSGPAGVPSRG